MYIQRFRKGSSYNAHPAMVSLNTAQPNITGREYPLVTIPFDTIVYDPSERWNLTLQGYSVISTGLYRAHMNLLVDGLEPTHTLGSAYFVISPGDKLYYTFIGSPFQQSTPDERLLSMQSDALLYATAGEIITPKFRVLSIAQTVGLQPSTPYDFVTFCEICKVG